MSRIVFPRGSGVSLESVTVYPVWVRVMHSFNKFDIQNETEGDMKMHRPGYGARAQVVGFFRTPVVLAWGPSASEHRLFWVRLDWEDVDLRLSVRADGTGGPWWNSLNFRGFEYIGSVLFSLQTWLDESDLQVIEFNT